MSAPINEFKATLKEGRVQMGCWVGLVGATAAEVSATAGWDWLLIDGEHAPNDVSSIIDQLRVIEGSGSHPIVRVVSGETWKIKQLTDAGVQTLLVPMVETGEQAAELVRAMRYPPEGIRGAGAALARASSYGGRSDYLTTANAQMCLLVQVESATAHRNLDDILAVEDVDGVFVGPADLAADMGYLGQSNAPEVLEAIRDILRRTVGAGKAAGILSPDLSFAQECLDLGATFVATGIDVTLFARAMKDAALAAKALSFDG